MESTVKNKYVKVVPKDGNEASMIMFKLASNVILVKLRSVNQWHVLHAVKGYMEALLVCALAVRMVSIQILKDRSVAKTASMAKSLVAGQSVKNVD